MIKGCQRRVVMIKNPKNPLFEEAYFIIREEYAADEIDHDDIVGEAERLISEYAQKKERKKKRKLSVAELLFFASGTLISGIVYAVIQFAV